MFKNLRDVIFRPQLLATAFFVGFFLFGHVPFAFAIGVSPSQLTVDSILRNTKQERVFSIIKDMDQLNQDLFYTVEFGGDFVSTFSGEASFEIPAGTQSYDYVVTIQPSDAPNGDYSGFITFSEGGKPELEKATAAVAVVRGVRVSIGYTVDGKEKTEYELLNLVARTAEEDDPMSVLYTVDNTGNVAWRPTRLVLSFLNKTDEAADQSVDINGAELEYANPGTRSDFSVETPILLSQGTYTAHGIFYDGDAIVGTLDSQQFDIVAANTLEQKGTVTFVKTNKLQYEVGENIKIDAAFENTGDVRLDATLIADIYKDDELVDYVRSDSKTTIDIGETATLTYVLKLNEPGEYRLSVGAEYGAKKTAFLDTTFTVVGAQFSGAIVSAIAIFILCMILSIIMIFWKRHKNQNSDSPSSVSGVKSRSSASVSSNKK